MVYRFSLFRLAAGEVSLVMVCKENRMRGRYKVQEGSRYQRETRFVK